MVYSDPDIKITSHKNLHCIRLSSLLLPQCHKLEQDDVQAHHTSNMSSSRQVNLYIAPNINTEAKRSFEPLAIRH